MNKSKHPEAEKTAGGTELAEGAGQVKELSRDEKRRFYAQIIRASLVDCFDETGAFDVARARSVLPAGALQSVSVRETTHTDKQGNTTVKRNIQVRLVDRLEVMRLDEMLQQEEEKEQAEARARALKEKREALGQAGLN